MNARKDEPKPQAPAAARGDFVVTTDHAKTVSVEDLERARDELAARRRQFSDEVSIDILRLVVG